MIDDNKVVPSPPPAGSPEPEPIAKRHQRLIFSIGSQRLAFDFYMGNRVMAVATIGRDRVSLAAEAALEQNDLKALEFVLVSAKPRNRRPNTATFPEATVKSVEP